MSIIRRIVQRIKHRFVEPKVYALHMIVPMPGGVAQMYLWLGVSYDLDNALVQAKKEAARSVPGTEFAMWQMAFHVDMKITDLLQRMVHFDIAEEKRVETDRNDLMKLILETKDHALFEEVKPKLTKEQVVYLQTKLSELQ